MHAKFLLPRRAGRESAWLGSYNFNRHSRWSNSEVHCRTADHETIAAQPDCDCWTGTFVFRGGVT